MTGHPPCRHDLNRRGARAPAVRCPAGKNGGPMSDLVAIAYNSLGEAQEVATNAAEAQKAHLLELDDMVVVERRGDGKVKLHQPSAAGAGAVGGALWGGLIGLI